MCQSITSINKRSGVYLYNEDGVTLLEIMVYMVISGMMLGAAVMMFTGQNNTYNKQDIIAETQQNIRAAMQMMVPEIRYAGFDPAGKGVNGFITATSTSLSFDYWKDTDEDGDYDDETDIQTIVYDLYDAYSDGTTDIGRSVGGSKRALAENINLLTFEYLYWNFNTNVWAWATSSAAIETVLSLPADKALEQIRAVKITIQGLARSSAFGARDSDIFERQMSVVVQSRNNRG